MLVVKIIVVEDFMVKIFGKQFGKKPVPASVQAAYSVGLKNQNWLGDVRGQVDAAQSYMQSSTEDPLTVLKESAKYIKRADLKLGSLDKDSVTYSAGSKESAAAKDTILRYSKSVVDTSVSTAASSAKAAKDLVDEWSRMLRNGAAIPPINVARESLSRLTSDVETGSRYFNDVLSAAKKFGTLDAAKMKELRTYVNSHLSELKKAGNDMKSANQGYEALRKRALRGEFEKKEGARKKEIMDETDRRIQKLKDLKFNFKL
ncbi:MAG: hypothetical protein HY051_02315 [Candidatus Aenigmarchaeota archaeon]|nr:hypothetical protein [Candidatus Aenigmarchaeota archaeon]